MISNNIALKLQFANIYYLIHPSNESCLDCDLKCALYSKI